MANESVVKATVIYDTSQMKEGAAQTVVALKDMAAQATVTSEGMANKSMVMAQAAVQAAKTIKDADLEIAEASNKATAAKRKLVETTRDLKAGAGDAKDALILQAEAMVALGKATDELRAKQEAYAAGVKASIPQLAFLNALEADAGGSAHKAVTDIQAMSGSIRTFEGNPGIRALEVFMSRTLGLGPAVQKFFPLIGAAAFLSVLFDVGKKIYEIEQSGANAGKELTKGFAEITEELTLANREMAVMDDRLEDEIGKLEKKPSTGLQTGLDEAALAAAKLGKELDKDIEKVEKLTKEKGVGFWASLLSGAAETKEASDLLVKVKKDIDGVRSEYDLVVERANASGDKDNLAQAETQRAVALVKAYGEGTAKIVAAQAAAQRAQDFHASPAASLGAASKERGGGVSFDSVKDQSGNLGILGGGVEMLAQEQAAIGLALRKGSDEQAKAVLEGGKGAVESTNKAAEMQLRAMENARSEEMRLGAASEEQRGLLSAQADREFWIGRLEAFEEGSAEYRTVYEKITKDEIAIEKEASELRRSQRRAAVELSNYEMPAGVLKGQEEFNKETVKQGEDIDRTGARWDTYNQAVGRGKEIAASMTAAIEESSLKARESAGTVSVLGAAHERQASHAKALKEELEALAGVLAKLEKQAATSPKSISGALLDPALAAKIESVKNQIAEKSGRGAAQASQDATVVSAAIARPYVLAFDAIGQSWLRVQGSLISGNKNISRAFAEMGSQLVNDAAVWAERWLGRRALAYVRDVALHHASEASKTAATVTADTTNVASAVTAAATSQAATAAASVPQVTSLAAVAAAGAAASTAAIPFVGPALAPGAAATMFGLIAGTYGPLAAFEKGGIVEGMPGMAMPILAHSGERVLSLTQTQKFERMVDGGSGAGAMHVNLGGNNFAAAGGDFKSQWDANVRHIVRSLKGLRRSGHI